MSSEQTTTTTTSGKPPEPYQLWKQSEGNPARYVELMIEHGHILPRDALDSLSDNDRLVAATRRERVEAEARDFKRQFDSHTLSVTRPVSMLMFNAECSCHLWALENQQLSHAIDLAACRELVRPRHEEHVREMVTKFEAGTTTGGGSRPCTPFRQTSAKGRVITGTLCGGRSSGRKRCQVCKSKSRWSVAQCDYPTGGNCKPCQGTGERGGVEGLRAYNCHDCAGTGRAMCNTHLCASCRLRGKAEDEDYCPDHRERAGLKLKREPCRWGEARVAGKCARQGCEEVVSEGERCLWLTERQRPLCLPCGARYLEVSG